MWRTSAVLEGEAERLTFAFIVHVFVFLCFAGIFPIIEMPPKKGSQAGFLNFSKRKDRESTGEADESNITSAPVARGVDCEARVRSEVGVESGEVGVESGEVGVGSGLVGVVGSGELMVGVGSEQTRGDSDDEHDSTVKRVKIYDVCAMAAEPINEWLDNLPRDDVQHMALLLYSNLSKEFGLQKTNTASVVASFQHKNERTIRRWIDDFVSNDGEFSDTQQGHYVRDKTLMSNEELCERATVYVRENAAPRGRPNLTASAFCQWVNNELLPNSVLDPGYPRRVSVETARKWLHELGFEILQRSKGVFIDGHERPDVVESRVKFLTTMTECGFLRPDNAPTEEAAKTLPELMSHTCQKKVKNILYGFTMRVHTTQLKTHQFCGGRKAI